MKSANAQMDALLATKGPFFMADCYTFTSADSSTSARWTDCDRVVKTAAVNPAANLFVPGPLLSRSKTRLVLGLETSTMTVKLTANSSTLWNGVPIIKAIRQGQLDGASITVSRCIAASYETILSGGARRIVMFAGIVSDVEIANLTATFTVVSKAYLFDDQLPRNTYTPGCIRTLYDTGCTLVKSTYARTGTVSSASSNTNIVTNLFDADDYFSLGTITFTSGANVGITRTIRSSLATGAWSVSLPFPVQPSSGDAFTAYPGCDKLMTTCDLKFGNKNNFRGHSYVPNPELLA